jgi:ABC-type Mn2+/Zn2+ transport system ATPase subunit
MVATHDLDQAASHFDRIMLLNHRIIAFGEPQNVMRTNNLIKAYGGRLRSTDDGNVLTVDDCCDDQ